MSILIKGMKMPSSCSDPNHGCDLSWCGVLCKVHNLDDISSYDEERAPFCPLVEVPTQHGRLIDENAILQGEGRYMVTLSKEAILVDTIKAAPTVIEAEE